MSLTDPLPQTQYARSGEYYLAYQVFGEGPQTLLFIGGFLSHLELMWEEPGLAQFLRSLSQFARVIMFDKRGVGLSDRVGSSPTTEETMEDILVIMNAIDCEPTAIMSVSEGGPVALMFAATYPSRTSRLILYGTMPKWVRSYDYPWALSRSQYDKWLQSMIENWGEPISLPTFAPSRADDPYFRTWWGKMLRQAASPGSVREVLEALREIDVRPVLPHVHVPALVLHRTGDRAIPIAGGRFLAQQLPNATFVELIGQDHWWWIGDADAVLQEIERFLTHTTSQNMDENFAISPMVETLTEREMDVLQLLAVGYTNQQIADELFLTLGTVKTYTSHIYGKLNVSNRTQAITHARKQGLIR
ncbi:MAG: alpha/beta fold hydrolase [Candidatus Promineifilaceae bacterium]|nr:alpha/beta fold hydrolase [Candidatus Promineifilaceae bacterium]